MKHFYKTEIPTAESIEKLWTLWQDLQKESEVGEVWKNNAIPAFSQKLRELNQKALETGEYFGLCTLTEDSQKLSAEVKGLRNKGEKLSLPELSKVQGLVLYHEERQVDRALVEHSIDREELLAKGIGESLLSEEITRLIDEGLFSTDDFKKWYDTALQYYLTPYTLERGLNNNKITPKWIVNMKKQVAEQNAQVKTTQITERIAKVVEPEKEVEFGELVFEGRNDGAPFTNKYGEMLDKHRADYVVKLREYLKEEVKDFDNDAMPDNLKYIAPELEDKGYNIGVDILAHSPSTTAKLLNIETQLYRHWFDIALKAYTAQYEQQVEDTADEVQIDDLDYIYETITH